MEDKRFRDRLFTRNRFNIGCHTQEEIAEKTVGEDAVIKANIKAKSVSIGGKVVGDVNCEGKVELFPSGSLEGKVKASDLTIAEGALFNGECRMGPSKSQLISPKSD